jgi:hypothetical protein
MSTSKSPARFGVISGLQVRRALSGREDVVRVVPETCLLHPAGRSVNLSSYSLRFLDRPSSHIIASPLSSRGEGSIDGLKPISSFPDNLDAGTPRAVEHCLKADPSPHPAEKLTGDRAFVRCTLAEEITRRVGTPTDHPVIFSPSRPGVLDLAVRKYVHHRVAAAGGLHRRLLPRSTPVPMTLRQRREAS